MKSQEEVEEDLDEIRDDLRRYKALVIMAMPEQWDGICIKWHAEASCYEVLADGGAVVGHGETVANAIDSAIEITGMVI